MGGDGMGALALVILLGCMLMIGLPALLGGWLAYKTFAPGPARDLKAALVAVACAGLGLLAVFATFFESTWEPSNQVVLTLPPGFSHDWIVLLEKPDAPQALQWRGVNLPFFSKTTDVAVPPSGVVVVQSLAGISGGYAQALLSTGEVSMGASYGLAAASLGYGSYAAFERPVAGQTGPGSEFDTQVLREPQALLRFLALRQGAK